MIALYLARGTRAHLVEEGAARTLCDRQTGVNPRYAYPRFKASLRWADEPTCPKCIALTQTTEEAPMGTQIAAENLTDFNRIARYADGKAAQVETVAVDRGNGIVTVTVKPHGKFGTESVVFRAGEMVEVA